MNRVLHSTIRVEVVRASPLSSKIFRDSHRPTSNLQESAAMTAKVVAAKRLLASMASMGSIGAAC